MVDAKLSPKKMLVLKPSSQVWPNKLTAIRGIIISWILIISMLLRVESGPSQTLWDSERLRSPTGWTDQRALHLRTYSLCYECNLSMNISFFPFNLSWWSMSLYCPPHTPLATSHTVLHSNRPLRRDLSCHSVYFTISLTQWVRTANGRLSARSRPHLPVCI